MRTAIAAGLAAAAISTAGCANDRPQSPGPTIERNFAVSKFDRIELAGAYEATVRTGVAPSVHAKGGQNVLDRLTVEVRDGKLLIHPEKHRGIRWNWGQSGKVE